GEIVGLDGVGNEEHECQAIALEDSEVCVLPFDRVEQIARESAAFQHNVHRYLSREIARQRTLMLLLGTMRADQRLAAFLLDLSQRYQARGYSSSRSPERRLLSPSAVREIAAPIRCAVSISVVVTTARSGLSSMSMIRFIGCPPRSCPASFRTRRSNSSRCAA